MRCVNLQGTRPEKICLHQQIPVHLLPESSQSGIELFYEIHLNYILFFYFSSKNLFIKKTVPDKKGTHKKEKKSHFSLHEPSQNQ